MSDRDPKEKLSEHQKFQARHELGNDSLRYDYQVKINNGINKNKSGFSWPIRSVLPIPLDTLINLCGGHTGVFTIPAWHTVAAEIPERYHSNLGSIPPDHFKVIVDALRNIIDTQYSIKPVRSVVLLLQDQPLKESRSTSKDSMEVLFTRVNAGGTPLQGEEMAYSLLKASWDDAYNLVSSLVKDDEIGYLLSPTEIVMSATRLSRFINGHSDQPNPGISNFRKWIGERNDGNLFLNTIRSLLVLESDGTSSFHKTLYNFCKLVRYDETQVDDIGLPRKLLISINTSIYQPVLTWIYLHRNNQELIKSNRLNILRFLVYSYLTVQSHQKASKAVSDYLFNNKPVNFPDEEIYYMLVKKELSMLLPTPEQFNVVFNGNDGLLRSYEDFFNGDNFGDFRNRFWEAKGLLIWFQRCYLQKWFVGYNPLSGDHYDTPYDIDHITPYSHLIVSGGSVNVYESDKDLRNKFMDNRRRYVNSIGNARLWPYWANRGDNNRCHTDKLRMKGFDLQQDPNAQELGLSSPADFLEASSIVLADEELWLNSGGAVRDWNQTRRQSWQQAVENRVCYLYKKMYTNFNFEKWEPSIGEIIKVKE